MTEHEVLIAGGGPTGMMLGAELTLAGVDAAIVEPSATRDREGGSRAGGLHSRTIEVFDMRGIADRFLSQGQTAQVVRFANASLDISDFPTRHPYGLALFQNRTERIMADWLDELHVKFYRGREVTGFVQDLAAMYNEASIVVAPLRFGAGSCRKSGGCSDRATSARPRSPCRSP